MDEEADGVGEYDLKMKKDLRDEKKVAPTQATRKAWADEAKARSAIVVVRETKKGGWLDGLLAQHARPKEE
jgi:hypothetical protein